MLLRLKLISVGTASNGKESQDIRYFDPKRKELSADQHQAENRYLLKRY